MYNCEHLTTGELVDLMAEINGTATFTERLLDNEMEIQKGILNKLHASTDRLNDCTAILNKLESMQDAVVKELKKRGVTVK